MASRRELDDLRGRVAIVAGGGRGVGRAVALELGALGVEVCVVDNGSEVDGRGHSDDPAHQVAEEIVSAGGAARAEVCNVGSWQECSDLVQRIVSDRGRLHILVNAAGNFISDTVVSATVEGRDRLRRVHHDGVLNLATCVARHWDVNRDYGRFVQFLSDAAMRGVADTFSYAAAKGSGLGAVRAGAEYFRGTGVTFHGVTQDSRTRMKAAYHGGSATPSRELEDPATVAPLVVHLVAAGDPASSGRIYGSYGDRYVRWSEPVHDRSVGGHGAPIRTGDPLFSEIDRLHE